MKELKYKVEDKALIEVEIELVDVKDLKVPYKVKTKNGVEFWVEEKNLENKTIEVPKPELPYGCEYIGKMMEVSDYEDFKVAKEAFVLYKDKHLKYPYNILRSNGEGVSVYRFARPITDKKQSNKKKVKELEKRVKELEDLLELKESNKEAEASKKDVKKGDKVVIIANINNHNYNIGEKVTILEVNALPFLDEPITHLAVNINGTKKYIKEDDFELI